MKFPRHLLAVALALAAGGCGVVYKIDVNQGNLLEQENVNALKPGMTRRQVALIMGTPSVQSPFDQDRWSYTASLSKRGRDADIKSLTLFFEDNVLVKIEGDYFPQRDTELLEESKQMKGIYDDESDEDKKKRRRRGRDTSEG